MKKYKNIREHYSRVSYTPPYASEAADDLDINLGVLDEESISRINAYLQQQTASYINPNNALNKIQRRLSTIGLVFTFPKERPYVRTESNLTITSESFPISYMGGRTGVLDANYNIGTDDNIRWRTGYGLKLSVQYTLPSDGGLVTVSPRIEMVAGVTESLTTKSREDQIRNAKIKVDRNRKKLKSQFAKYGNRTSMSRDNIEASLNDIGSDYKSATPPYTRNPSIDRMKKSIKTLQRKRYSIKGKYDESVTTKSPKDQLKSTVRHYNKLFNRQLGKLATAEADKPAHERNSPHQVVKAAKLKYYDKARLTEHPPANSVHRKLANVETKVARKRIKAANHDRPIIRGNRKESFSNLTENSTLKTRRDQAASAKYNYDRNIKRGLKSIAKSGLKAGVHRNDIEDALYDTRSALKNNPDVASKMTRASARYDRLDRNMNKSANTYDRKMRQSMRHDSDQFSKDQYVSDRLKPRIKKYGS